jgi:hypothetical protein
MLSFLKLLLTTVIQCLRSTWNLRQLPINLFLIYNGGLDLLLNLKFSILHKKVPHISDESKRKLRITISNTPATHLP